MTLSSKPAPRFVLKHTNCYREVHYLVALGDAWPGRADRRMVAETSKDIAKAARFDTYPEAVEVLRTAGEPPDYVVEAV